MPPVFPIADFQLALPYVIKDDLLLLDYENVVFKLAKF